MWEGEVQVLQLMASRLPRGSFQKLGLSAIHLRTAFSSLTSSLTSLRSDAMGGNGRAAGALTERQASFHPHMQTSLKLSLSVKSRAWMMLSSPLENEFLQRTIWVMQGELESGLGMLVAAARSGRVNTRE